jgi:ribosomal protein S17E
MFPVFTATYSMFILADYEHNKKIIFKEASFIRKRYLTNTVSSITRLALLHKQDVHNDHSIQISSL